MTHVLSQVPLRLSFDAAGIYRIMFTKSWGFCRRYAGMILQALLAAYAEPRELTFVDVDTLWATFSFSPTHVAAAKAVRAGRGNARQFATRCTGKSDSEVCAAVRRVGNGVRGGDGALSQPRPLTPLCHQAFPARLRGSGHRGQRSNFLIFDPENVQEPADSDATPP